jgi:pheromone shutdown protein TraB
MIVIIGTGHVFRISESVSFIIKNIWPDAVFVELDERRYKALTSENNAARQEDLSKLPKSYQKSAKYQEKMSAENDTQAGGELLAAIQMAKIVGAQVVCIDMDAERVMADMEKEMSFTEKVRYSWSIRTDGIFGSKKVDKVQKEFSADEKTYIEAMRKKYPTFVRKLIDERNEYMARKIMEEHSKYGSIVVVVGDAHVEGLSVLLPDLDIHKIRLADLLDPERLEKIKDAVWNDELGKKGNI